MHPEDLECAEHSKNEVIPRLSYCTVPEEFVTAVKGTSVFTPVYIEDKLCIFCGLDRLGIPVASFKIQHPQRLEKSSSLSSLAWLREGGCRVGRCHGG